MRKTFKYRLVPTEAQQQTMEVVLGHCRAVYNTALEQRQTWWERGQGKSATYFQQKAELPELKAGCPEFAAVHAHVLQDVILRVDRAFQAFFRRVKAGETPGYPRFRGPGRYNSFTFPEYGNGARLDGNVLSLSKIGRVAIRLHRPIVGVPKAVTISREADGWYAAISCSEVPVRPLPATGTATGIDLGIEAFATLADGSRVYSPTYYRRAEAYLRRCQRRVSRRAKGSQRRAKTVKLVSKAHQHIRRQRREFHHREALKLVQAHDTVYHEKLRVANMVRNHALAKSISDAGWSSFLTILSFKAECAGRRVVGVPPKWTSQRCFGCGELVVKGLSVRWHRCPHCSASLHRDHNAALNIMWLGQEQEVGRDAAVRR